MKTTYRLQLIWKLLG